MLTSKSFQATIGGAPARSASRLFDVLNPFDGKVVAQAPVCGAAELDAAVKAAREALPSWAARPWAERQKALRDCANLLMSNKKELAQLLTLEQGKGIKQAEAELMGSFAWMQMAAKHESPNRVLRETDKERVEQQYRPIGVVGCLSSFNFPVLLSHFKIAQALLAGCTLVLKPSEHTPLCTLEMVRLYNEVLPAGVLNIVTSDDRDLGRLLVEHPDVDKISFTGSTATGKRILAGAAGTLKRTTMELGGNDPALVLGDVDANKVAPYIFRGAMGNSGQVCMAIKRIYAHESIFEDLCKALGEQAAKASFGDGMSNLYGPINNADQYNKVRAMLIEALDQGAEIVHGSVPPPLEQQSGYLFPPVILKNVKEGHRIVDEEQFGPVVPVLSFKTEAEALERANATSYGLGASVWTNDAEHGAALAAQLNAGTAWVNQHGQIIDDMPFGGAKESGIGHEGGHEGLLAFMQLHVVKIKKNARL